MERLRLAADHYAGEASPDAPRHPWTAPESPVEQEALVRRWAIGEISQALTGCASVEWMDSATIDLLSADRLRELLADARARGGRSAVALARALARKGEVRPGDLEDVPIQVRDALVPGLKAAPNEVARLFREETSNVARGHLANHLVGLPFEALLALRTGLRPAAWHHVAPALAFARPADALELVATVDSPDARRVLLEAIPAADPARIDALRVGRPAKERDEQALWAALLARSAPARALSLFEESCIRPGAYIPTGSSWYDTFREIRKTGALDQAEVRRLYGETGAIEGAHGESLREVLACALVCKADEFATLSTSHRNPEDFMVVDTPAAILETYPRCAFTSRRALASMFSELDPGTLRRLYTDEGSDELRGLLAGKVTGGTPAELYALLHEESAVDARRRLVGALARHGGAALPELLSLLGDADAGIRLDAALGIDALPPPVYDAA